MTMPIVLIGYLNSQMYYALKALLNASFNDIYVLHICDLQQEPPNLLNEIKNYPSVKIYDLNLWRFLRIKPSQAKINLLMKANQLRVWFIRKAISRLVHLIVKEREKKVLIANFFNYPLLRSTSSYIVFQYAYGPYQLDHVYIKSVKNTFLKKFLSLIQVFTDKGSISIARHCINLANSKYTALYLSKFLKDAHIEVLYPPCDVRYFRIPRTQLSRKKDIVITAGRITSEKRLELIIALAERLNQYTFLITGKLEDLKYYNSLLKTIKSKRLCNIKIVPNPSKHQLRYLYLDSKVYFHAMRGEHFGKTIVEAMAGGCIPVVPVLGGCKEIIDGIGYVYYNLTDAEMKIRKLMSCWNENYAYKAIERSKLFDVNAYEKSFLCILEKYIDKKLVNQK